MPYRSRANRLANMKSRYRRYKEAGLCPGCGKSKPRPGKTRCGRCASVHRDWYHANKDRILQVHAKYYRELWAKVLNGYGRSCTCCGETSIEFLTIDHVNGDGKQDRKRHKNCQSNLLRWIIKNNFPKTLRLLCMNCNFSLGMYGYCPHKRRLRRVG